MRKKLYSFILVLLIASSEFVFGKEANKIKSHTSSHKLHNNQKEKFTTHRIKRSFDEEEDKPFWTNRGKKLLENPTYDTRYDSDLEKIPKSLKYADNSEKEPFWGTRGRRDSDEVKSYMDDELEYSIDNSNCKHCFGTIHRFIDSEKNMKTRKDKNLTPFWGNRGRRYSEYFEGFNNPFSENGRIRQHYEPFWSTRSQRQISPISITKGLREDEPFWGNRGRREVEPFWGSRGRRDKNEPFWGNRGRREDADPFWGNRGKRQDSEPFWGNRGRRDENEPFWGNRGRRMISESLETYYQKQNLKESILRAISYVQNDVKHLSRLKKSNPNSFWSNRGRDSKLKYLFNGPTRNRVMSQRMSSPSDIGFKKSDSGIVTDSRLYADEPNYIVVERNSRSSSEADDPYYISRGKKYYLNYNFLKAARDRRGAIEEIVKSVLNDPYYIARGKKDNGKLVNDANDDELSKAKELICSAINLLTFKNQHGKLKREIDSDRERRTILKKLAAQLQIDPYYVSRGKKSEENDKDDKLLVDFVKGIADKC